MNLFTYLLLRMLTLNWNYDLLFGRVYIDFELPPHCNFLQTFLVFLQFQMKNYLHRNPDCKRKSILIVCILDIVTWMNHTKVIVKRYVWTLIWGRGIIRPTVFWKLVARRHQLWWLWPVFFHYLIWKWFFFLNQNIFGWLPHDDHL